MWNIWKARTNFIFKGLQLDPQWIAISSIDYVKEFSKEGNYQREIFFLNSFNLYASQCHRYTNGSWIPGSQIGNSGFVIVNTYRKIVFAEAREQMLILHLKLNYMQLTLG